MLKQTQALLPHFPVSFFIYCSIFLPPTPHKTTFLKRLLSPPTLPVFSISLKNNLNQLSSHPYYNASWVINVLHSPNQMASFPSLHGSCSLTYDTFTVCILKHYTWLLLSLFSFCFGHHSCVYFAEFFPLLPKLRTRNAPKVVLLSFLLSICPPLLPVSSSTTLFGVLYTNDCPIWSLVFTSLI